VRVVWVSHGIVARGGAELAIVEAKKALEPLGVDVQIVAPEARRRDVVSLTDDPGVVTVRYGWWAWDRRLPLLRQVRDALVVGPREAAAVLRFVRLFRRLEPDVVVTNTVTIPAAAVAARVLGIPHVWYLHEFGQVDHDLALVLGTRGTRAAVRALSSHVIVNSEAVRRHYFPDGDGAAPAVIPYSVEVEAAAPTARIEPTAPLTLVNVGNLKATKGQEDAVRAIAILRARGIDAQLRLVGAEYDDYGARLRALVAAAGVEDRVSFLGFQPDPFVEVAAADVVIVCSRNEAFGRATVEAMKLGKAVVAAAAAGTAELVRDGENGLLYPPGDTEALADCLERLHADRRLIETLGDNARTWATETFTRSRYGDALRAVLEAAAS
jgi:glycosyltransferase involved in cell wall biosynthesis